MKNREIPVIYECHNWECDNHVMNPKSEMLIKIYQIKQEPYLAENEYCKYCGKILVDINLIKENKNVKNVDVMCRLIK